MPIPFCLFSIGSYMPIDIDIPSQVASVISSQVALESANTKRYVPFLDALLCASCWSIQRHGHYGHHSGRFNLAEL